MTGQSLLDRMELLNAELQLQAGEENVTKGLLALNVAQDYFESLAALRGKVLGSSTGTVATASSTESTAFPAGLLRIDRLQVLDATTQRPIRELRPLRRAGGHAGSSYWPLYLFATNTAGMPWAYEATGGAIWWNPLPDTVYTVRWYGFSAASDITASGTFAYPDVVALPIASFATRLYKSGLDDDARDLDALAQSTFGTVLDTLSLFNRDGAVGLEYTQVHNA